MAEATTQVKKITHDEWMAEGKSLFGDNVKQWRFVCPSCGHIQTGQDFIDAGIDNPQDKFYYSCIGRWTGGKGTIGNKKSPCNYTCGGLFVLSNVRVLFEDEETPVFDFDYSKKD